MCEPTKHTGESSPCPPPVDVLPNPSPSSNTPAAASSMASSPRPAAALAGEGGVSLGPPDGITRLQRELAGLEANLRDETDKRSRAEAAVSEAAAREAALRTEALNLHQQVRDLKAWVSTSTRTTLSAIGSGVSGLETTMAAGAEAAAAVAAAAVTSDDELAEAMVRLAHGLQNWVLTHFRRAVLTVSKARDGQDDDGAVACDFFEQLVPLDLDHGLKGLGTVARLPLLQAAAARLLVDGIFAAYFVGLPAADAALLAKTEARLGAYAPPGLVRQWHIQTLALVATDSAQQLPAETARVTDTVVASITRVLDGLTKPAAPVAVTASVSTASRDRGLRQLVKNAIALARLLAAQRAEYDVFLPMVQPHQQVLFDPSTMENMGGGGMEDDSDDAEDDGADGNPAQRRREVAFVVFPGLIKHGDETGRHVQQYTNVLCKARVVCVWEAS